MARKAESKGKTGKGKRRPGLPKPDSITGERPFTSPRGTRYRILSTDEKDAYEENGTPKQARKKKASRPKRKY